MVEYIDREALIDDLNHFAPERYNALINMLIEKQPAADVVEVVRCGECIHNYGIKSNCEFNPHDIVCGWWVTDGMDEKDFCCRGERRSE